MYSRLLIPPAVEPIQLDHLKAHLRVQHDAENGLLLATLMAAREEFERTANRAILAQTWQCTVDGWSHSLRLPRTPLQTVTGITYRDADNAIQTLATDQYLIEAPSPDLPARIVPPYGVIWPTLYPQSALTIQYVAGFAVPVTVDVATNEFTALGRVFAIGDQVIFSMVAEDHAGLPRPLSAFRPYYVRWTDGATFLVSETLGGGDIDMMSPANGQLFVGHIPEGIRHYLKLMVAHRYENREPVNVGNSVNAMPLAAESLFWAYRVKEFA